MRASCKDFVIDRLIVAQERLERLARQPVLQPELEWVRDVEEALAEVRRALRHRGTNLEGPRNALSQIPEAERVLVPHMDELCWEHGYLLELAEFLRQETRIAAEALEHQAKRPFLVPWLPGRTRAEEIINLASIHRQVRQFLEALKRHEEEETELLLENPSVVG